MNYIYGPVPSRRLGRSLGIDPIPSKTCNYQCIYCQLGRTTNFTNNRRNYAPKKEIFEEMEEAVPKCEEDFDYVTFVGSGEPTLYMDIKDLIQKVKTLTSKPVCVITNGALLSNDLVKDALYQSDVVLPTLDAGTESTFIKINRPHPSLKFDEIIQGLVDFRSEFGGKFWIEIMLVKGINDSKEDLLHIKNKIDLIQPDKIDVNVPIRPPCEKWVKIPNTSILSHLSDLFGNYNNINFPEIGKFGIDSPRFEKEILSIIERHPMRQKQIIDTFRSDQFSDNEIEVKLELLQAKELIEKIEYQNDTFWRKNLNKIHKSGDN